MTLVQRITLHTPQGLPAKFRLKKLLWKKVTEKYVDVEMYCEELSGTSPTTVGRVLCPLYTREKTSLALLTKNVSTPSCFYNLPTT